MKISTILDHIDSGHIALPEFQRGYVWSRNQVRRLFYSLYRRHPVGGLLVWTTGTGTAKHRGDGPVSDGVVKLLLDGQQRITSLYGVARGKPPEFFEGNEQVFTGLFFHIETESFAFWQPVKMKDDPLWIDVTALMTAGYDGLGHITADILRNNEHSIINKIYSRLNKVLGILDITLHVDEITGSDKTLDVVVDIFNRVNSGGTRLSKGDLALAKICAGWPEAREEMNARLERWAGRGYRFTLDWLLRSVNAVLTGEAKFGHLHDRSASEIQKNLKHASDHIDYILDLIADQLGLDHDGVFFGPNSMPVMVRYLHLHGKNGQIADAKERDKLLFWFVQAGMWGRFSGSTETSIDKDLTALEGPDGGLDALLEQLRLWRGGLRVEPGHFDASNLGARFYPVLYLLTRLGEACDWGTGLPLKGSMLGRKSSLEVHHIFPKAQLSKRGRKPAEVNALANYCFLTKNTNLRIADKLPEEYFPEVERAHPGALESQWIPMDRSLWKPERYPDFLEARRALLAAEANRRLEALLHDDPRWLAVSTPASPEPAPPPPPPPPPPPIGGISGEAEERELNALNGWVAGYGLSRGEIAFDYADPETGVQKAVFDLVWPEGLKRGLSEPVAVLLNETDDVLALASAAGFRCFTAIAPFQNYVQTEILGLEAA